MTAGSVLPATPAGPEMPAPLGVGRPSSPASLVRADEAMDGLRECELPMLDMEALDEWPCSRRLLVDPYRAGGGII